MASEPADFSTPLPDSVRELKNRHIAMIALGGVIGAGLFVGSSAAIAQAGPAILLTFAFTGALVVVVMRLLGEMLIARPGLGSFLDYIAQGSGPCAGFVAGWLYWAFWVVTVGSEAIAGAILLQDWIRLPVWVMATALVTINGLINITAVRVFGEVEFWLSLIKVACIVGFCCIGLLFLTGLTGGHPAPLHTLLGHGGLFPHGAAPLLSILPTVLFTMVGSEIATVAAAETRNASRNLARVTRTIGTRVTLFYFLSLLIVLCIKPWDRIPPGQSPFVLAMDVIGVPGASILMRVVILSAVLSCLNSSLFVTARTLRDLAFKNQAPVVFGTIFRNGAPGIAVGFSSLIGLLAAFSSILAPGTVFAFLLGATGGVMLLIYLLILVSHLRMRQAAARQEQSWAFSAVPFFPLADYCAIGAILLVGMAMLLDPLQRPTVLSSLGSACMAAIAYVFLGRKEKD